MGYLISQTIGCLLIAAAIGAVIGYLLKQFWAGKMIEQVESMWSDKVRAMSRDLESARGETKTQAQRAVEAERAEVDGVGRLKSVQAELTAERDKSAAARSDLAGNLSLVASLEGAVLDWKAKLEAAVKKAAELEGLVQSKGALIDDLEARLATAAKVSSANDLNIQTLVADIAELTPLKEKLTTALTAVGAWENRNKSFEISKNGELAASKKRISELEPLNAKVRDWEFRYSGMLNEKDASLAKLTANVAALEPFKARVESAAKENQALLARIKSVEAEKDVIINSLRARVADIEPLEQMLHSAGEEVGKLRVRVGELEPRVKENETLLLRIKGLETSEKEHLSKVHKLEESLKHSTTAVGEHETLVTSLRARVADIEPLKRMLHSAGEEVGKLRVRVGELEPRVKENETLLLRIKGLETGEKEHLSKIHKLEESLKHSTVAAVEHETLVSSLRSRVADIEPLEHKLHAAGEEVGKLRVSVGELEPRVKENETLLLRIRGLESGEKDHLAKIHKLEESLKHAAAIEAGMAALELALAEEKHHHERLRLRVDELEPVQAKFHDFEKKLHGETEGSGKLSVRLTEIEAALTAEKKRTHDLEAFQIRTGELEQKLHSESDASAKLRLRIQELEPIQVKFVEMEKHSKSEIAALKAKIIEASTYANDWEARFGQHSKESATTILGRDAEISKLKSNIAEIEALQKKLKAQEDRLQAWDGRFSSAVNEKDSEITRLRFELGQLMPLRDEVVMLNSRYQSVVSEKDMEIERLCGQLNVVPVSGAATSAPAKSPKPEKSDDLKKIKGIGPVIEKRLHESGVHFFKQIALWSKQDTIDFETHWPEFHNRVERDQWVAGAKEEHLKKYGETL